MRQRRDHVTRCSIHAGIDTSAWFYMEDIWLRPPNTYSKYAAHHSSSEMSIVSRSHLDHSDPAAVGGLGGNTPIGIDGVTNGTTVLYDCDLKLGAPTCTATSPRPNRTVMFIDVRTPAHLDFGAQ